MCLTLVIHQTDNEPEFRHSAIIDPNSGHKVFNPYENTFEDRRLGDAVEEEGCSLHDLCTKIEWQICNAKHDESACFGWQNFHMVLSNHNEHPILSRLGEPLGPSDERKVSSDIHIPYIKLREEYWLAGSLVGFWARQLIESNNKLEVQGTLLHDDGYLLECCKSARKELQLYIDKLEELASRWRIHSQLGKMEPCPSDGLACNPFAEFFQMSPESGTSPYQLLKDTDSEAA
ncbi:hypothetical protein G7Z17_g4082 [Cylindrodendrum hubeiense]|uniref:Uncharacterized protein n=1 Tax=Cylindrodendrum hubeiense TaxID=595255 RepID=A0A9P5H9H7_9HYPO|nr:hypothetical protein G7Z17_g4082 [Cylindrodendrum hubeiense]